KPPARRRWATRHGLHAVPADDLATGGVSSTRAAFRPVQTLRQHGRGRFLLDPAAEGCRRRQTARSAYGADRLWGQRRIRRPPARSGPGITVSSAYDSLQTRRAVYLAPARGRGDEVHRRSLM